MVRQRAQENGRSLSYGIRLHVIVRETEEEAWAAAERLISHLDEETIAAAQKLLRGGNSLFIQMRNQPLGRRPGFLFGFTDNDMQPDAVGEATAILLRPLTNHRQFFRYLFNRLAPRQISVDLIRRNVDSGIRRTTKIFWWFV